MRRKPMPAAQNLSRHGDAGNGAEEKAASGDAPRNRERPVKTDDGWYYSPAPKSARISARIASRTAAGWL